jgi:serine/threonine protein kinase
MSDETQLYSPSESTLQSFGKYRIMEEIGNGAMGVVYKCWDPHFKRAIAVKVLSPELLATDDTGEFKQRFCNEMVAAGKFTHPNVINVYDAGEQNGIPYFVMEFVEGYELKKPMDEGVRFPLEKSLAIFRDILKGLGKIHAEGIVHRDLKPANIFITLEGTAKIADFGVAKLENSELTHVGTVIGSPRYMSPEQCQGLSLDSRSDLFSAGIIFYQLLTNEYCFNANSSTALMQKIVNSQPELPSVLMPTLGKAFDPIIQKALMKRPEDRYQTAEAFQSAIDAVMAKATATAGSAKKPVIWGVSLVGAAGLAGLLYSSFYYDWPAPSASSKPSTSSTLAIVAPADPATGTIDNAPPAAATGAATESADANASLPAANKNSLKIDKLLRVARAHQMQGRLITPSGSSAWDVYQTVLSIEPGNQAALKGLSELEFLLVQRIEDYQHSGQTDLARSDARAAIQLFPDSARLSAIANP